MAKWLVKTEPTECGIDDFASAPTTPIPWDGVRNYQARNFLRQMHIGDEVLIYHSSCRHIGVAGIVRVTRSAYPDPTQFDPQSPYYDARSRQDAPRWDAVDLTWQQSLPRIIPLQTLKATGGLEEMPLVRRGNRLSVMPVSEQQWQIILGLN